MRIFFFAQNRFSPNMVIFGPELWDIASYNKRVFIFKYLQKKQVISWRKSCKNRLIIPNRGIFLQNLQKHWSLKTHINLFNDKVFRKLEMHFSWHLKVLNIILIQSRGSQTFSFYGIKYLKKSSSRRSVFLLKKTIWASLFLI